MYFLLSCKRRSSSSRWLFLAPIGSYYALLRIAMVLEAVMCRFFRLAGLTGAGRRTFRPLSIEVRTLVIRGQTRADFFKSLHKSAKFASGELFADFLRTFFLMKCTLFAHFLQTFSHLMQT